ncbi:hypothetical protein [Paenibacillus zanthoxyli]|uniref:hypothetical protein n=1 Tax=Paenibacillus zanthoxyli TaxID=369399 RepID=UPI0012EC0174|nr:hypothetical protein [Paenibacillus zanthoxyli]
MKADSSNAVMVPLKSLSIWKTINKQCIRQNLQLDTANRSLKTMQTVLERNRWEITRALNRVDKSVQDMSQSLLSVLEKLIPKIVVVKDTSMQESRQKAAQSQQMGAAVWSSSGSRAAAGVQAAEKKEAEKAKKVKWWKGINLTPQKPPEREEKPGFGTRVMDSLKSLNVTRPFNAVKSIGEKAIKAAAKPGDIADWNQMNKNVDKLFGKMGEKAMGALRPVMDVLNKALTSNQFAPIIDSIAQAFLVVANVLAMVVNGFLWLVSVITANWDIIKPILEAIAVVYLAALIIQLYAAVAGVLAMAAAWLVANWPILLVIAAIALVFFVLQKLGVSAGEAVGAVVGAFGVLIAFIQNVGIFFYNTFTAIGDFLTNLFNDPVYTIQKLLYNLAMQTLNVLYSMAQGAEGFAGGFMKVMADAFNWIINKFNSMVDEMSGIPFFDKLGIGKLKMELLNPEAPHAASETIDKFRKDLSAFEPQTDKEQRHTDKKSYVSYSEAYKKYSKKGEDFVDSFSNVGRKAKDATKDKTGAKTQDLAGAASGSRTGLTLFGNQGGNINNVARVGEVGSVKDTVDISSDDLAMLRELAEIQAIQNFVELTPTVQVTTGNINNAGDIDSIINKINKKLSEEFVSTAQGVYT